MTTLSINGRFYAARPTGVQRVARELVGRLVRRADVTLHLPAGCSAPRAVVDRCTVVRGRLGGVPWEQAELPWRRLGEGRALPLDPANSAPLTGPRGVMVLHDVLPLTHPQFYTPAFRRWFALGPARAARRARRVVTFSAWARDRAIETLGLEPGRITVLPQGVEPFHEPCSVQRVEGARARLGLPERFILALGGGDPRKSPGFVERIVERWPEGRGPPPDVVVVGDADGRIQASGALGVAPRPPGTLAADTDTAGRGASRVHRMGHVSDGDLHALYTAASVFCFPSRAEGFGRPPLEAMGCGTPVVAGDYGCAREVLGDAAVILPLEPGAWAEAVAALVNDGAPRRARIAAGRAQAGRFSWNAAVDQLLAVCREAGAEPEHASAAVLRDAPGLPGAGAS